MRMARMAPSRRGGPLELRQLPRKDGVTSLSEAHGKEVNDLRRPFSLAGCRRDPCRRTEGPIGGDAPGRAVAANPLPWHPR